MLVSSQGPATTHGISDAKKVVLLLRPEPMNQKDWAEKNMLRARVWSLALNGI